MSELCAQLVSLCGVVAVAECFAQLCREDSMLRFVRGISVLLLFVSFCLSLRSADFSISLPQMEADARARRLESLVSSELADATEQEYRTYLSGLLAAAGLCAEKIELDISNNEDGSIVLDRAAFWFSYQSECDRARALLTGVLEQEVEVQVYVSTT